MKHHFNLNENKFTCFPCEDKLLYSSSREAIPEVSMFTKSTTTYQLSDCFITYLFCRMFFMRQSQYRKLQRYYCNKIIEILLEVSRITSWIVLFEFPLSSSDSSWVTHFMILETKFEHD